MFVFIVHKCDIYSDHYNHGVVKHSICSVVLNLQFYFIFFPKQSLLSP